MERITRKEPYLSVLTSNWVVFPLLLILGFGAGFISAGYDRVRRGYELLPAEIIVKPPAPTTTICFPDMGFIGALQLQKELAARMRHTPLRQYSDSLLQGSIRACAANSDGRFVLRLLHTSPTRFQVIATETGDFRPYGSYTLVTESGCYYLHPIPKRRSADYDSLIQVYARQRAANSK